MRAIERAVALAFRTADVHRAEIVRVIPMTRPVNGMPRRDRDREANDVPGQLAIPDRVASPSDAEPVALEAAFPAGSLLLRADVAISFATRPLRGDLVQAVSRPDQPVFAISRVRADDFGRLHIDLAPTAPTAD